MWTRKKKSESQMGFEPTPLRDLQYYALTTELLETLWLARVNLWVSLHLISLEFLSLY